MFSEPAFEEGYYAGLAGKKFYKVKTEISKQGALIHQAVVGLPPFLPTSELQPSEILTVWKKVSSESWMLQLDLKERIQRARYAEAITSPENAWKLCNMAFDSKDSALTRNWQKICQAIAQGKILEFPDEVFKAADPAQKMNLKTMESTFRLMDLYYQYFRKFGYPQQMYDILSRKNQLAQRIMDYMETHKPESRKCKYCNKTLS